MSIFLEMLEMQEPEISPLLMEVLIRELPKCSAKGFNDEQTLAYIQATYRTVMEQDITPEQGALVLRTLLDDVNAAGEGGAESAPARQARFFASHLADFLGKLELDDCCFLLAQGDYEKARSMYRYCDYRLVRAMRKTFHALELQRAQVLLEGVVYGMGGSFDGDGSGDGEYYDLVNEDYTAAQLNEMLKF